MKRLFLLPLFILVSAFLAGTLTSGAQARQDLTFTFPIPLSQIPDAPPGTEKVIGKFTTPAGGTCTVTVINDPGEESYMNRGNDILISWEGGSAQLVDVERANKWRSSATVPCGTNLTFTATLGLADGIELPLNTPLAHLSLKAEVVVVVSCGCQTTVPSTTASPTTTAPPTTVVPTTAPPTTVVQTTVSPTTAPPTTTPITQAPTTVRPTTIPQTVPPTTVSRTTVPPTTVVPTTVSWTTVPPTIAPPTMVVPTTAPPITVAPTAEAPPTVVPTIVVQTTVVPPPTELSVVAPEITTPPPPLTTAAPALPRTGSNTGWIVSRAIIVIAVGILLLIMAVRRRGRPA